MLLRNEAWIIDLDEFEGAWAGHAPADQRDGDPLAELFRIIGDKDEPHKTDFEPKTQQTVWKLHSRAIFR